MASVRHAVSEQKTARMNERGMEERKEKGGGTTGERIRKENGKRIKKIEKRVEQTICLDADYPAVCMQHKAKCAYDTAHDKRRPVSKAYMIALEDRVAWLEGMLESQGASGDADEKLDDVLDEALLARPVTRSYRRQAMQASTDKPTEDPEEPESHLQVGYDGDGRRMTNSKQLRGF